jgi:Ran GTPase-activating protein (RanGAP) involved in mRNA processing and transport
MLLIGAIVRDYNCTLQHINFDDCDIGDSELIVFVEMALMKSTVCNLSSIGLVGNRISDNCICSLAVGLKLNNTIQKLDIGFNNFGCRGVSALTKCLSISISLQILVLEGNNIGNVGAEAIGEALKINTSLHYLGLGRCKIGNDGFIAILKALCCNSNSLLADLDFQLNNVNDVVASELSAAIENKKILLKKLHLQCNDLSDVGATQIAIAQQYLLLLDLSDNSIQWNGILQIVRIQ